MNFVDTVGAFCPHGLFELAPTGDGLLDGLTFAVKDLIDVSGRVTGAGNPRWLETHSPATRTAPCVARLLHAGARMVGKTITDELAYSVNGDNIHYGTPKNTRAPDRVPGGSSSGSTAAVAAGLVDFALGTDSGGSVRIPASYCGTYGIRTTVGVIAMDGIVPFMPTFDTVGWFARDANTFSAVGDVLLPYAGGEACGRPARLLIATDAMSIADPDAVPVLRRAVDTLREVFARADPIEIAPKGLEHWRETYRTISAHEAWQNNAEWIEAHGDSLSPPIAERFAYAKTISDAAASAARREQSEIRRHVRSLIGSDGVLCLPSAPGVAPKLEAVGEEVEAFRKRVQRLTSIAGLAGLPQISLPGYHIKGAPVGLSLIGAAGSDRILLELACKLSARTIQAHAISSPTGQNRPGIQCD
jgi:amidase